MAELNEDKQIEEYIRETLKNFTIPVSEETKTTLLQEFQNIKHQHSSFKLSLHDILKNPTFKIISISILIILFIIYIFVKLSPSSPKENISNTDVSYYDTTPNTHLPQSNKDSILEKSSNKNVSNDSLSTSSPATTTNTVIQSNTTTTITNTNVSPNTTHNVDSSSQFTNNPLPKKKKRKRKSDTENNTINESANLPVLEPKTPELKPSLKEEE
ncbi:MAG: hypothetical protein KatS3mg027_0633 [Bacteroidia bacterium]|nr:MAG: hypothetical protein KatS3mg027_0633 [Bacteroidia bacterium]